MIKSTCLFKQILAYTSNFGNLSVKVFKLIYVNYTI
ncbi:hypothetical protein ACVWYG_000602 [Pedobacter sp. UYEF25]